MEAVGRKFSHRPGNPATVEVVRWPSAGDDAPTITVQNLRLEDKIKTYLHEILTHTHTHAHTFSTVCYARNKAMS